MVIKPKSKKEEANAYWFGYNGPKPVQFHMYNMVLQFSGENTVAQAMVQEASKGTWLNNSDHPHFIWLGHTQDRL